MEIIFLTTIKTLQQCYLDYIRKGAKARGRYIKINLTMGYHYGRLQLIPPMYDLPKMTVKKLIDNWFIGNKSEKIPLFMLFVLNNVEHLGTNKNSKG